MTRILLLALALLGCETALVPTCHGGWESRCPYGLEAYCQIGDSYAGGVHVPVCTPGSGELAVCDPLYGGGIPVCDRPRGGHYADAGSDGG